jgi:hypothetical protein
VLRSFTTPYIRAPVFTPFLQKINSCHTLIGHPSPKNDIVRVRASCTLRTHLKVCLNINLVVLVVILLLDSENFLVCEKDVFVSVLGMPLQEMLCSCPSDFLQSRSKEVSL